jgi:hypothetical protein
VFSPHNLGFFFKAPKACANGGYSLTQIFAIVFLEQFAIHVMHHPPPLFGDILNLMCNFDSLIKTLREKGHFLTNWFSTTCRL